ncbi:MAG TPA: hypothetical protein VGX23_13320 [Actinocrinis sp.]|nr:hypothetical protein [Actinocrinis sp.]
MAALLGPPCLGGGQTVSAVLDLGHTADGTRTAHYYAPGRDYGLPASRGYDEATGLGSPNARLLLFPLARHPMAHGPRRSPVVRSAGRTRWTA